ncbi:structural maintenance of chromosomes flexible hinge domain-containing protein gmi1 [Quercus suber]|uniref:Structural maintenance of chromosomes flexible hinge domain-containing protein gmi1 n=1 Tax=Quercus suber TaxID=58331 RepID=A0AAW0LHC3_QUESU
MLDTDAGFNPTPSKTDLAHHNPFTTALKNFGNKPPEKEKVIRVHQVLKRKGKSWKSGQKIKVLKGACAGCHKNNVYATLEYFLIEGCKGDVGVYECDSFNNFLINKRSCYFGLERPLGLPDDNACILEVNDGNPSFDIRGSLSLPIDVIDSGKCLAIESIEWNYQLDKLRQKSPSTIGLLSEQQCLDLEVDGKDSTCNNCIKRVLVKASSEVGKWELLDGERNPQYSVRVGSCFPPFYLGCFDIYDNRITFAHTPKVRIKIHTIKGVLVHVKKMSTELSRDKLTLKVKDVLIESNELDNIRPSYKAILMICPEKELFSVSVPCQVSPGSLQLVKAQPPMSENRLLPGCMVKQLLLEMFDAYGNHVSKGLEVQLDVDGFHVLDQTDQIGPKRKVDDNGCINLGGLLKVIAGFGSKASLSVLSGREVVFKQELQIEKRELRIASRVPEFCTAGTELENIIFEIVNSEGDVDETIHDEDKYGQSHTLTIKSESLNTEDSIRYTFKHGRCTVPAIPLPQKNGMFCFEASHSRHPELNLSIQVSVQAPKVEYDDIQSPSIDGNVLLLQDSSSLKQVEKVMVSMINNEKKLEDKIIQIGYRIGNLEKQLNTHTKRKEEVEQDLFQLQASVNPNYFPTKEELINWIESMNHSAAAVLCSLSREFSFQEQPNHFLEDIIGLVALLEYLGEDQMLAVVCRSFVTASALENYEQNGGVDCGQALHAAAAARGNSIDGRFLVICLEDLRPYSGKYERSDPQRKLALPYPTLPRGNVPRGFIGYAVNMIDLDIDHLHTRTAAGHGLRETVLYRLLGEVQVYETRECMLEARRCIKHGAVSLDGGILRENGVISLGYGDPRICFPVVTPDSELLAGNVEVMKLIEEKKEELDVITSSIRKMTKSHEKSLKKFKKKKEKFDKFMDNMEPVLKDYYLEYKSKSKSDNSPC